MSMQYRQGRYVLAENLGRDILNRDPTNLDVHYLMGNVYYKLDDTKSAALQYSYCLQTGPNTAVAKLAAAALESLKTRQQQSDRAGATAAAASSAPEAAEKLVDPAKLKRAKDILERAQDALIFKKKQLDTTIVHTEEFARSRIKDIPFNTIYRRMSAFAGIEAARDNEDYYAAPNYDRPVEVAHIRATETAKVRRYIDDYNSQERKIVTDALKEADSLLGGTANLDGKPQSATTTNSLIISDSKTPKAPATATELLTACGITIQSQSGAQQVIMVATGSAAHRAGLAPGDLLVQSTFIPESDVLKLTIERHGRHYAIKLHPAASAAAKAASERLAQAKSSASSLAPKLTSSQLAWARIKDSDIVFVQDMSSSMRLPLGDTGLSKWDWCAGRIVDFAESLSRGTNVGFTLVQCYQYVYELYRDQNPAALRQHFVASRAIEAANLTTPLEYVGSEYFDSHSQKPLLIMVFTDGHPERGESMEIAVKGIVDRMKSPDQVRLVFFQIGDDPQGTAMMHLLDDDLAYAGHKYDIVDWVKFDELQDSGVSRSLLDAYERPRAVGQTVPPVMSQALTAKLEEVNKKIASGKTN